MKLKSEDEHVAEVFAPLCKVLFNNIVTNNFVKLK